MGEWTQVSCCALVLFVKHADWRMPTITISVVEALSSSLALEAMRSIVFVSLPLGLVPVRVLFSLPGEGCRRSAGLGVRCRLSPLSVPLFWSSCLKENFASVEHAPVDVYPQTGTTGMIRSDSSDARFLLLIFQNVFGLCLQLSKDFLAVGFGLTFWGKIMYCKSVVVY